MENTASDTNKKDKTPAVKAYRNTCISQRRRVRTLFLLILILVITEYFQIRYRAFCMDDAYISYRYSKNFSGGYGLVYNKGERVEGYSNLLLVLILTPFIKFGFDPHLISICIGHVSGLTTLLVIFAIAAKRRGVSYSTLIAPLLLAFNFSFTLWSNSGLETQLNTALLSLSVYLCYRAYFLGERQYSKYYLIVSILFMLNRPENVLLLPAWFFLVVCLRSENLVFIAKEKLSVAIVCAGVVLLFGWRMLYYGQMMPNTVYAKSYYGALISSGQLSILGAIREAVTSTLPYDYLKGFLDSIGGKWTVCIALIPFVLCRGVRVMIYVAGIILSYVALVFWARWDWMPRWRLLECTIPLVFFLFQEGIFELYRFLGGNKWRGIRCTIAGLIVVCVLLGSFQVARTSPSRHHIAYQRISRKLNEVLAAGDLLATLTAGVSAYYYEGNVLDIFGLTDKHIARNGTPRLKGRNVGGKEDLNYVWEQKPTYFLLNNGHWARYKLFKGREHRAEEYLYLIEQEYKKLNIHFLIRKDKFRANDFQAIFPHGSFANLSLDLLH